MTGSDSPTALGRPALLAILAGAFGSLDTALNIAFPDLSDDFDLNVSGLQWVVTCFVLTYGVSLIVAGRLGDRHGHSAVMSVGAVVAAIGLGVCGAAPGLPVLLVGRVVQGMGTALVMASAPPLIALASGLNSRGRAVGLFQTSAGVGLALGPVVGGPLVDAFGWRGVFWFRLPLAALMVLVATPLVRVFRASHTNPTAATTAEPAQWRRLLRSGDFVAANSLAVVLNGAMFATWLLVPALLVDEMGLGLVLAGAVLAASPAATALISPRAGRWSDEGQTGQLVVGGILMVALGMGTLSQATAEWNVGAVALGLATVGLGLGLFSAPNMATVMAALPRSQQGLGAGLSLTNRTVGIVIGVNASSRLFDQARNDQSFADAFELVFLLMTAVLLLAGAAEFVRRVGSST